MDHAIKTAIDSAYSIEREYGFLCDEQSRSDATFTALRRLAETSDVEVLSGCPDWLISELNRWVQAFRDTGDFGFVSNLGTVDHTPLMNSVANLISTNNKIIPLSK